MFSFPWWNQKKALPPTVSSTNAAKWALGASTIEVSVYFIADAPPVVHGDLYLLKGDQPEIQFKFRKPLHSLRQEDALVLSNDHATPELASNSPQFPVPYVAGASVLETFPTYVTIGDAPRIFVDADLVKKRCNLHYC